MRYGEEDRESSNVEDRRGEGGGMFRGGGGIPSQFQPGGGLRALQLQAAVQLPGGTRGGLLRLLPRLEVLVDQVDRVVVRQFGVGRF